MFCAFSHYNLRIFSWGQRKKMFNMIFLLLKYITHGSCWTTPLYMTVIFKILLAFYRVPFVPKLENFHDIINRSLFIKIYGSLRWTFPFQYNGVIQMSILDFRNNRPTTYNQSQAPNLTETSCWHSIQRDDSWYLRSAFY